MKRMMWALVLICFHVDAVADETAKPLTIPFSESGDGLGLQAAQEESLAWGPSDICISKKGIWVADSVNSRVTLWGNKANLKESRTTPFPPAGLWCNAEGHTWVMNGSKEQAFFTDGKAPGTSYPLPDKTAHFTTGPSGAPWVILQDGHSVPLVGKAGIRRAIPMGKDRAFHAIGRKVNGTTGEILVWAWNAPAEVKGAGPVRTVKVEVDGLLGSITPIGMDAEGRLFIHVESLGKGIPVRVRHQILRVTRKGERTQIQWEPSALHPHLDGRYLSTNHDLFRFSSLADGLVIQSFGPRDWQEVSP